MPTQAYFFCVDCKQTKPVQKVGGTGYAETDQGRVCYDCCAIRDQRIMRETERHVLYLSRNNAEKWEVTNWPGTLRFAARTVRISDHNIAGKNGRSDVWFIFEGAIWHGVNIGDNQICQCRRTKRKTFP